MNSEDINNIEWSKILMAIAFAIVFIMQAWSQLQHKSSQMQHDATKEYQEVAKEVQDFHAEEIADTLTKEQIRELLAPTLTREQIMEMIKESHE